MGVRWDIMWEAFKYYIGPMFVLIFLFLVIIAGINWVENKERNER